ncbi:MAG: hypothetical protein WBW88_15755 [Rhodothermales bacterium]
MTVAALTVGQPDKLSQCSIVRLCRRGVAFLARDLHMTAGERERGLVMPETLSICPLFRSMTVGTGTSNKLIFVGVVGRVTRKAGGVQSEERLPVRFGRVDGSQHVLINNQGLSMTRRARAACMRSEKFIAGLTVVE